MARMEQKQYDWLEPALGEPRFARLNWSGKIPKVKFWCRRRESNPHARKAPPPQDGASASSATSALVS